MFTYDLGAFNSCFVYLIVVQRTAVVVQPSLFANVKHITCRLGFTSLDFTITERKAGHRKWPRPLLIP